jgi:hypoxanthine-guanine phosphoribosyltransferase
MKKLYSKKDLEKALESIVLEIVVKAKDYDSVLFVPVMDGAMHLMTDIAYKMEKCFPNIKYDMMSVKTSSYTKDGEKKAVKVYGELEGKYRNSLIIILDDIYDTGATVKAVTEKIISSDDFKYGTLNDIFVTTLFSRFQESGRIEMAKGVYIEFYSPLVFKKLGWLCGYTLGSDTNNGSDRSKVEIFIK